MNIGVLVQTIKNHKLFATFALISVAGMSLVWLHQSSYGVGLSPDAIQYISTSENLSNGRGFTRLRGGNFTLPPLFELGLGFFIGISTADGFVAARYVNIIIFGLTILVLLIWISNKVHSKFWLVWAGVACALSPALIHVSLYARTDSMFILFSALSLWKLDQWLTNGKNPYALNSHLILAAMYASLSLLTRFTGFAVVFSSLLIIGFRKSAKFSSKFKCATTYIIIAASPSGIWMLRNYFTVGRLTSPYEWEGNDWSDILESASYDIINMMLGNTGYNYLMGYSDRFGISQMSIRVLFLVASAIFLSSAIIYLYRIRSSTYVNWLTSSLMFVLIYMLFLSASFSLEIAGYLSRYLTPIYIPLLVVVTIVFDRVFKMQPSPALQISSQRKYTKLNYWRYSAGIVIRLIAIGYIVMLIPPTIEKMKTWREYGISYLSKGWVESETVNYLKSNPLNGIIYSNIHRLIYTHMNIPEEAEVSLHQLRSRGLSANEYTWDNNDYVWEDKSQAADLNRYIVWFHGRYSFHDPPYDFLQIAHLSGLKIFQVLEDGVVLADEGVSPYPALDAVLGGARLAVHSKFDIYLDDDRLIYVAESCRDADTETTFLLHIVPTDFDDLPDQRKALGVNFDNHDFRFDREGFPFGERCAVIRNLPDYDIELIRTGQFNSQGDVLWKEEIHNLRPASGRSN